MAYTTNIPAATDIPAQSQTLMQQNCTELQTAISRNHEPLGNANSGQHINIEFTGVGTVPTTNFGLYATGAAMLLRNAGTNFDITTFTNSIVAGGEGQGSVTLPSGLIIKFGKNHGSGTGVDTIGFTNAFPTGQLAAFVSVISTNLPAIVNADVYNLAINQIRVKATNYAGTAYSTASFYWLAIGY
jgi:hypothetical protein